MYQFLIKKGDFSLLEDFGTHQREDENSKLASSAVAFIDSPLLKDCDILDLPGFAATSKDDALHRFNTQTNTTDILLYMSRANGFLQDRDLDYLHKCIESLRPIEKSGENSLDKLCNLFIIASQSGTVEKGNASELKEILNRRCKALCDSYALAAKETGKDTLLSFRTTQTGYKYNENDFRKRFFTYEKAMPRLCKDFDTVFTKLAEELPQALHQDFTLLLKETVKDSNDIIQERIDEWFKLLENKEKYAELVRKIEQEEPARIIEQKEKSGQMRKFISECCTRSKQDIQSKYDATLNEGALLDLIDRYGVKNKKRSKEDFSTSVNALIKDHIQTIMQNQADRYSEQLKKYLSEYSDSIMNYSPKNEQIVDFNAANSFRLGLASLGALGASAVWLSSSFTAFSVALLGASAGWGALLAVGGAIGIAIASAIAAVVSIIHLFTWKEDLAKSIIDAYKNEEYIETIFRDVEQYWADTESSFISASQRVEQDWQDRISEYKSIADEKNIPLLEAKIAEAKKGLDFFTKMPMPEVG